MKTTRRVYMEEDERKENGYIENDVRISHRNLLWYVYRSLAEDVIISDERDLMIIKSEKK